jgi:endonuclease G
MVIPKIHSFVGILLFLLIVPGVNSQICSGCEIPSGVRTQRLNRATQANAAALAQQAEIEATQFPFGMHRSPSDADNERVLFQKEWVAVYDDDLRMPVWVSYKLTKAESSSTVAIRQDCFRRDYRLPGEVASECEDYEEPLFDRGHMLPANDSKRRQSMMDNGFLFSNMTPQFENFNRKVWQRLEAHVHNWAISSNGLFIITGAVFDRDNDGQRDPDSDAVRMAPLNRVAVPSHFYKILIHVRTSGVIDTLYRFNNCSD